MHIHNIPQEKSSSLTKLGYPDIIYMPQNGIVRLFSKVCILIYCKWLAIFNLHLRELDNGFLQVGEVRSNNGLLNLAIFIKDKCRHGLDTQFLSYVGLLIDVERVEPSILVFAGPPEEVYQLQRDLGRRI